ncbi:MAG TPA: AAA family ATPase [Sphingomonadaceae bacterium]|nr:AAA family ATPase [Sphingomonadaceae bacterium]
MYADHYGLSGLPFGEAADPAFYFGSETHRQAMACLGDALAQGEGMAIVTGAGGTGKSMLIGHFLATIDRAASLPVRLTASNGKSILKDVLEAFGIKQDNPVESEALAAFEQLLESQAGRQIVLAIDDAQLLSASALASLCQLSNLRADNGGSARLLLFGSPVLRQTLDALGMKVMARHELTPLRPEEVEPYIEHRLALVGCLGAPRFAGDAFAALYDRTKGVPRALNRLLDRLLMQGASEGRSILDSEAVARAAEIEPTDDGSSLAARIAALEARVAEQEVAVRRALGLLIEWVERGPKGLGDRPIL